MLLLVRYGIPAVLLTVGLSLLVIRRDTLGLEGWALSWGAGLAILLLNVLFRVGAKGDQERRSEDDARDFYSRHGHWPDEEPTPGSHPPP